ncbi:hypothetical protein [Dactylosporangium sp. NPDC048998]|uniref:hypothetical protein n=1 Tax=Dactylosporangium sp. NPDC048998 TaxID=3363976 RepID=UPI0037154FB5
MYGSIDLDFDHAQPNQPVAPAGLPRRHHSARGMDRLAWRRAPPVAANHDLEAAHNHGSMQAKR